MKERIQKILSSHGVVSRREAERLIAQGRVTVNGSPAAIGQSADPSVDVIAIDGVAIPQAEERVYIMLNKPRGYITTMKDDRGRPTVTDLIEDCPVRVYPVGRLDMDSEGLLIMTNDGSFAEKLAHPSNEKEKTYHAKVMGELEKALKPLSEAMDIDGYRIRPAKVKLLEKNRGGGLLSVTIHEGRNRQVRKMCAKCGLSVVSLIRISVGGIHIGDLQSGKWRHLSREELEILNR